MPDAPPQIAADGGGASPSSPVVIAAAGGGASPSAPPVVAAAGGGASPSAPGVVATDGGATDAGVVISGTLSPDVTGYLQQTGVDAGSGLPVYDSGTGVVPDTGVFIQVRWADPAWQILYYDDGLAGSINSWIASPGTEATPDLASGWAPDGAETGTPVVTLVSKAAPPQVAANGSAASPSAPPAIV